MVILIRSHNRQDFGKRLKDHVKRGGKVLSSGSYKEPDRDVTLHWARIDLGGTAR